VSTRSTELVFGLMLYLPKNLLQFWRRNEMLNKASRHEPCSKGDPVVR
jgi:hypothetical protein